jgi:hypothetical protein
MSFTKQYADDLAMGCVCDYDVPCPSHAAGRWTNVPGPDLSGPQCAEFGHLFQWYTDGPDGVPVVFDTEECQGDCGGRRVLIVPTFGDEPDPEPAKTQTHAAYRREWIREWRYETEDTASGARLAFEQMLNQSWDGCTCDEHGGARY